MDYQALALVSAAGALMTLVNSIAWAFKAMAHFRLKQIGADGAFAWRRMWINLGWSAAFSLVCFFAQRMSPLSF